MRLLGVCSFTLVACAAFGDNYLYHAGQFFELRDLSGLSGSGFGVTKLGDPSIFGAMALSTPIGFSLRGNTYDFGILSRSVDDAPQFINTNTGSHNNSDGTAQLEVGAGTPIGDFTLSYEVISSKFDQIYNAQWQLPIKWDKGAVSIGCQNITNRPEAAPDRFPGESDLSRSFFAVATYEVYKGDFVSLGTGDVRYHGVFGNACAMVTPRLKATLEYDSFAWNAGLAYSFGKIRDLGDQLDNNETTIWAGFLDGRSATVALNFAF